MEQQQQGKLDDLTQRQHGLLTSKQASSLLGPSRTAYWVRTGRLSVVQPKVYRLLGAPPTWHQHVLAAVLSTDGVASHRTAAEMWGLIRSAGYVEVSVRHPKEPTLRPPAIVHRIRDLHPGLALERDGIRLTDPVRTLIDLGLVLPSWAVANALSQSLTSKLISVDEVARLRDALARPGRNGTGVIRELLERRRLTADTEESVLEARLVDILRDTSLPLPTFQYEVWHAGRFVARVDAAFPERRLALEVDGYAHHTSPEAFQRDRSRQNQLVALGWAVLRFTWDDAVRRPESVARAIVDLWHKRSAAA